MLEQFFPIPLPLARNTELQNSAMLRTFRGFLLRCLLLKATRVNYVGRVIKRCPIVGIRKFAIAINGNDDGRYHITIQTRNRNRVSSFRTANYNTFRQTITLMEEDGRSGKNQ